MGKNKLSSKKLKNPIYMKAAAGVPLKTKSKAKQVKINLKQLKINNKEGIASLDQKLGTFREALQIQNKKEVKNSKPAKSGDNKPLVNVEETVEGLSQL